MMTLSEPVGQPYMVIPTCNLYVLSSEPQDGESRP